jgi:hypothetical protein
MRLSGFRAIVRICVDGRAQSPRPVCNWTVLVVRGSRNSCWADETGKALLHLFILSIWRAVSVRGMLGGKVTPNHWAQRPANGEFSVIY